jgi:anti-sigma regulatory factor (Ser/Thr protein kinase)
VRQARLLAVATLADWRLPELFEDVSLCVGEVAGNACRHAKRDGALIQVTLHLMGRFLSVHVRDPDFRLPTPRPLPDLDADGMPNWNNVDIIPESGYGCHLVETLADGWSWWLLPAGKVVAFWFRTDVTDAAA